MAKAEKREVTLTTKEKLEQALVSNTDHLYRLPMNWVYVYQKEICKLGKGEEKSGKALPYLEAKVLRGSKEAEMVESGNYIAAKTKVILVDGENSGEVFTVNEDGYMGSTFRVLIISSVVLSAYLTLYISTNKDYYRKNKKGSAIPHLDKELFYMTPFPLAPLSEQQRIVDCIENLFAKLDEAKEKVQAVVDGYENRKAAILHKAFTGELTENWRQVKEIDLSTWITVTSSSLFGFITSGSRGWSQFYSDEGAAFIRMGNLNHGTIELDLSDIQRIILPDKAEGKRSLVQNGDILISITADVGMIGLVRDIDFEGYINQHIALARPIDKDSAEFIAWYLVSDVGFNQLKSKQRGATKVGLGLDDIRALSLQMPCKEERIEIVRIISNLLHSEEEIKLSADNVITKIDLLKKAILDYAFRGKLGTNNPNDESAENLIKQLQMETIVSVESKKPIAGQKRKNKVGHMKESLLEVVSRQKRIPPEDLKNQTGLDIDEFYLQLKMLIDDGLLKESREGLNVFVEESNENR